MGLGLQRLSYEGLRQIAEGFLASHHPSRSLPVPIEQIAEGKFGITIIPIPNLQRDFDIDGFISSNFEEISVDEYEYMHREKRTRFTIAHELSHLILHQDILRAHPRNTIADYLAFRASITEDENSWLEWQARCLGGLILAPAAPLKDRFDSARTMAVKAGLDPNSEPTIAHVCDFVSRDFNVSAQVIQYRLWKDKLIAVEFPDS